MRRGTLALLLAASLLATASCTHKEQTTTSSSESAGAASPAPGEQPTAAAPSGTLYVTFVFSDIAVTTSAHPVLRLGFTAKNGGADPLLCTESAFSLLLADGTTLAPDAGAENRCDPDTLDPGSSGKVTMFFDLPKSYSGPVTVIMRDNSNAIIGEGTAQVH